jgi:hypothetical protein
MIRIMIIYVFNVVHVQPNLDPAELAAKAVEAAREAASLLTAINSEVQVGLPPQSKILP